MIDGHLHLRGAAETGVLVEVAEGYGVRRFMGIGDLPTIRQCRLAFPGRIHGVLRLPFEKIADAAEFETLSLSLLREGVADEELRGVKFWFTPEFNAVYGIFWDDPRLDRIFEFMVAHQLVALVHVSDPDLWFERTYRDRRRYTSKAAAYGQLENRLRQFPELRVQAAHLGGDPEHLDHLAALLERYPNLSLDLSATKWLARELSRQPAAARAFVIKYDARLIWGTDLVVGRYSLTDFDQYATRYYVHRQLWEGLGRLTSPIADADAGGPVEVEGLDLPLEVLEKIYHLNAERLYGLGKL